MPWMTSLQKVQMECSDIGDAGAAALSHVLPSMLSLQYLSMSVNKMSAAAGEVLVSR